YGNGSQEDLDDLEKRLESGERFLSFFTEFPSNPLLRCPDLQRIRQLANKYDFAVVIDETIGNFLNVHVLPYADVVVSSLTKVFSGDSNVMGGSAILNPAGRYYDALKKYMAQDYEDNFFEEDAMFLERNSRDFVSRIARINTNAETICDVLMQHPRIKQVNYPKYSPSKKYYDACRLPNGGYGGLLSATFYSMDDAIAFYDNLNTAKGPSLGTNFTLSSPYALLAHFTELDWAAQFGVEANLVRFSVGLEETEALKKVFQTALDAISQNETNGNADAA
ncbi:PLP-dependent transferase, partial [Aureobasidium melanogenum]